MADHDDEQRLRASQTGDRTVIGGAPVAGGGTMASSGAFDTVGGGDLGGPGSRDPGDATSELRDPVEEGGDDVQRPGYTPSALESTRTRQQGGGVGQTDLNQQRDPTTRDSSEKY